MSGGKMLSLWNKMFAEKNPVTPPAIAYTPGPAMPAQSPMPQLTRGSPTRPCLACEKSYIHSKHSAPPAVIPTRAWLMPRSGLQCWRRMSPPFTPMTQQCDCSEKGGLDDAITELRRGLEANPHYATGFSNLGFLYLRRAEPEQATTCLLQALEVDPKHPDAPNHLCDVLLALVDELTAIGLTDGFLSAQPGGNFDEYNRHIRTRNIGVLIAKIGNRGVFEAAGQVLETQLLMEIVINAVHKKMGAHHHSTGLQFTWQGIHGWNPPVAIPFPSAANAAYRGSSSGP